MNSTLSHNKATMKNKTTLYHLIIDRSGSMSDCVNQTVSSFNEQVQSIGNLQNEFQDQTFLVSLTTFADHVTPVYDRTDARDLPALQAHHYTPGGLTALNDAIGITIKQIDRTMGPMVERGEASVVVVILTDGGENCSKEFTGAAIAELIKGKESTGLWSFNFLGASFNAETVTTEYGLSAEKARSFDKADMNMAMNNVSQSMRSYAEAKAKGNMKEDFLSDFDN
jgi:uncharacterized protein YegL